MKNKKGFTLIELLAVIVILAIIALIAVPIILNMISKARKSAARDSALGYVDSINNNNELASMNEDYGINYEKITDGTKNVSEINSVVKMKGKKPTSGTVTIENGRVKSLNICIDGYTVISNNGKDVEVTGSCNSGSDSESATPVVHKPSVTSVSGATHKGIVYMNPTDLTVECTESNSQIGTGSANASGCMTFYIFDDSGSDYKMILDHNTTATVAWNSEGTNTEMKEVATQLATDTTGWVGSPRLITANEITTITNTTTFDGSSSKWFYFNGTGDNKQTEASSSQGDNEYAWLFDYTRRCKSYGCNTADSSNYGYWTSSPVSDTSAFVWVVGNYGDLNSEDGDVLDGDYFGVRPVITIAKSNLN